MTTQAGVEPSASRGARLPATGGGRQDPSHPRRRRRRPPARATAVLAGLVGALVAVVLLNLGTGAVAVPPGRVVAVVAEHLGLPGGGSAPVRDDAVVWQIRLPRVLLGALVGASLGVAGAALQGIFRNPLAEPSVIGVSSGAALGAVAAIVTGVTVFGVHTVTIAAFAGALVATLLVWGAARGHGRTEVVTLVLTGVGVSVVCSALTGLFTSTATDAQLRNIVFWTLGSLSGTTWAEVRTAAPLVIAGCALLLAFGRSLNVLALGDREAGHLGVPVDRLRLAVVVLVALVTGAATAVAGIVAFVGLVVPHAIRLAIGPDHRYLLPASVVGGALLVLAADLVARTAVVPRELPLGVLTAAVGGPFLLWLVHRARRADGGWA